MNFSQMLWDLFQNKPLNHSIKIKAAINQFAFLPLDVKEVEADCEKCETSKPFHNIEKDNSVLSINTNNDYYHKVAEFRCVSCGERYKNFSFIVQADCIEDKFKIYTITKYGEYPQKPLQRSKELEKFFQSDKDLYSKAVRCLANNYGIGAFVYFRRIIELNISSLLDKIASDDDSDVKNKQAINELRKESPMSDKIAIANRALPPYLLVDGHNPLGAMYKILSEGVHSLSDEECLKRAKVVQKCLLFLVSELANHKRRKLEFKDDLELMKTFD